MSQDVFPSLPGLSFPVVRAIVPPPVTISTTPSQREYRFRDATIPRYQYTLPYDMLRSDTVNLELQTLVNFYNQHGGPWDSWLFDDPDDDSTQGSLVLVGDGNTTLAQLTRVFGGVGTFSEPIFDLASQPRIYTTQSLNLLQQATAIGTSPWSGTVAFTPNTANSPDGTLDGDTLTDSSNTEVRYAHQPVSLIPDGQVYTASIYVLQTAGGTSPSFAMGVVWAGQVSANVIVVDTDTGNVIRQDPACGNVLVANFSSSDGTWFRISFEAQNPNANACDFFAYPAWNVHGQTGANASATGSAQVFGAKLEVGSKTSFTSRYYTVGPQGVVAIHSALPIGTTAYWDGTYYRRCRFVGDTWDVNKFMRQLWDTKAVKFISTNS